MTAAWTQAKRDGERVRRIYRNDIVSRLESLVAEPPLSPREDREASTIKDAIKEIRTLRELLLKDAGTWDEVVRGRVPGILGARARAIELRDAAAPTREVEP